MSISTLTIGIFLSIKSKSDQQVITDRDYPFYQYRTSSEELTFLTP